MPTTYFTLSATYVDETAATLKARVSERFPDSGISRVASVLHNTTSETNERLVALQHPNRPLRAISYAGLGICAAFTIGLAIFGAIDWTQFSKPLHFKEFVELAEALLGTAVFITAFIVFVLTIEKRRKHRLVVEALNELRSLAHVIDMHQLTKDPERARTKGPNTESSPKRDLSLFELGRYLDYCTEMLAIVSKVAALYAQAFPEETVLRTVDQIESLSNGLSRKIWQKIMLLKTAEEQK